MSGCFLGTNLLPCRGHVPAQGKDGIHARHGRPGKTEIAHTEVTLVAVLLYMPNGMKRGHRLSPLVQLCDAVLAGVDGKFTESASTAADFSHVKGIVLERARMLKGKADQAVAPSL